MRGGHPDSVYVVQCHFLSKQLCLLVFNITVFVFSENLVV